MLAIAQEVVSQLDVFPKAFVGWLVGWFMVLKKVWQRVYSSLNYSPPHGLKISLLIWVYV